MQTADFERFRDLMRGMGRLFGSEPDSVVLDTYWLALRDWSIEDFVAAASHLMRTHPYPSLPKPADFERLRKAGQPTAGEAWLRALAHCQSGAWRTAGGCGDPAVDKAAAMAGGYRAIALCDTAKLGFIENRFLEHYEASQDAEAVRAALPQLTDGADRLPAPDMQRLLR